MEATKYAQSLIEALINDTDKKFEQQLPKMKPLQPASVSHGGQKQKTSSSAKSNGMANSLPKDDQLSKSSMSKSGGNCAVGAWQQPSFMSVKSGGVVVTAVTVASAWSSDSTAVRASPEMNKMSFSDRAKAIIVSAATECSSVSRSPPIDKMKVLSMSNSASSSSSSIQLAASMPQRCEPQPLPIVTATGFPMPAAMSRLNANTASFMRDYSPFNNALSQIIAESVLAKRTDDFASVAAAGVVTSSPPLSMSYCEDATASMPPPASASDPHKAPGYKMSACSDPAKAPGHRASKDPSSSRTQIPISTSTEPGFRPSDYGRPSSMPNAAVNSSLAADISGPADQTLGASLDRPASFFAAYQVPPPPPPGLMQLGPVAATGDVYVLPPSQMHQFGAGQSTGSAVTETSVLAAPLMATSLASVSHPDSTGHGFSIPPPVTATSAGNSFTCVFCLRFVFKVVIEMKGGLVDGRTPDRCIMLTVRFGQHNSGVFVKYSLLVAP